MPKLAKVQIVVILWFGQQPVELTPLREFYKIITQFYLYFLDLSTAT